ncbi:solute carrier family 22 member 4-like isoform X1 [Alosa sapidissima]|uniref:solute carrier family 22 member 4-like isoform X1 n=1 Tax=Alosa sapidissima TaxID=34773 RepID=UPI001C0A59A3|nr:solute carrier family 22 member 4-like isoform X1 [Alosa sapidissima]
MADYDQTTAFLGVWGQFQQVVFFVLCFSTIPNGFSAFSVIFLAASPSHHCLIPEVNLTEAWRAAIIPSETVDGQAQQSMCSRYRLDVVKNFSDGGLVPGLDVNVTDIEQEKCLDGWSYSKDIYQSTIVTEFDLVCGQRWKESFTSSVYFIGVLFGSFFSGQLSDWCGRKPVLFMTMTIQTVFTFIQVFSTSWEMFSVIFFIVGMGQISNYVAAFVLGAEILSGSVRVLYSSLGVCFFFAIGYMMLPLIAFYIRDWRMLLVVLSVPGLIYIPLWWLIPESPRWLLSRGRVQEAEAILRDAARRNKVIAPDVIFLEVEDGSPKASVKYSFLDLLKVAKIRNITLILFLVWMTLSMGYFGLSLNTSRLHGDPYINCLISAAIEVPAYLISWLSVHFLPRRLSCMTSMMLAGVALYSVQIAPADLPTAARALEMLGKFGIATGTALMFVYTGELYPTVIRNTAVGACAMVSRVGSTVAPYLFYLNAYHAVLPHMVLGSLCVVSGVATFLLPESFRRPLPETLEAMHQRERIKCSCFSKEEDPNEKLQVKLTNKVLLEVKL